MEEFAKMVAAKSQTLVEFARDKQTTIRKLNGAGVFVTQSPSQVNQYPIGSTLREQCVTQIFLPNPGADHADYVEGFKLTETEFETIRNLAPDSRCFLVKQVGMNGNFVVVQRTARKFTLRLGNAVVGIFNEAFDRTGIETPTATVSPSVVREIKGGSR